MSDLSKRSTIYFDPSIHRALRLRAASSQVSVSELVDEAVKLLMREDQEDLAASAAGDRSECAFDFFEERLAQSRRGAHARVRLQQEFRVLAAAACREGPRVAHK